MPNVNRINHRKEVHEFLSFIGDKPPEFWEVFAEELKANDLLHAAVEEGKDEPYAAMTYEEAQKFGNKTCNFGIHRTKTYREIPYEYLAWLADQNVALLKYVKYRSQLEPSDAD